MTLRNMTPTVRGSLGDYNDQAAVEAAHTGTQGRNFPASSFHLPLCLVLSTLSTAARMRVACLRVLAVLVHHVVDVVHSTRGIHWARIGSRHVAVLCFF